MQRRVTWPRVLLHTAFALAIGTLFGFLVGFPWVGLFLALTGLFLWNLEQLIRLDRWLANPRLKTMPATDSYWQPVFDRIHSLLRSNKKRKKRLSAALKRYRRSTDAIPDATVLLNRNNEIEWINPSAVSELGLDRKRDRGKRIDQLIRAPRFLALLDARKPRPTTIPSPVDPRRLLHLKRVRFGEQESLLIARDITEQQRLDDMRRDFVANASHELKTPLTILNGYLETLVTRRGELPEAFRQAFDQMRGQGRRMSELIDDMLALARAEQERNGHGHREAVNVPALLRELIGEMRELDAGDREIDSDIDEALWIAADPEQLRALFGNLLFNAVRHTPNGSPVQIAWHATTKGARFTVEDLGPGIPAAQIPRLSERFYRGETPPTAKGSGLGLALVKHILESFDSQLDISSVVGEGSTFGFLLPSRFIRSAR